MKRFYLLALVLFGCQYLYAQGWNSTVSTTIEITSYSKARSFANKDGIHVLLTGSSNVKHVLLNRSGSVIRQTTLETASGAFPSIVGNNSKVYAVYQNGSYVKVQQTTDAGVSWDDAGVDDITMASSTCHGVDAAFNDWGLHVAWATPAEYNGWESYYQRLPVGGSWSNYKNVTDYVEYEKGGWPTITVSADRAHVSYNTSESGGEEDHTAPFKTRDFYVPGLQWQTPQQVDDASKAERIQADASYLYAFDVHISGDDPLAENLYFRKRTVGGTSWSTAEDLGSRRYQPRATSTTDSKLHLLAKNEITTLYYRNYNGSGWTSESNIGTASSNQWISSVSNDLYLTWMSSSSYLQYRQYDAVPLAPQNLTVSGAPDSHPILAWTANSEPDLSGYKVYRKIPPFVTEFILIATVNSATTSYTDNDIYLRSGSGDPQAHYYVKAYDASSYHSGASNTVVAYVHPPGWPKAAPDLPELPMVSQLFEAYPNPFNPSTEIRFALAEPARVSLVVYDALGREAASLADGHYEAGFHSAVWNASGRSSGVYFARIVVTNAAGQIALSKIYKLVLAK